MMAYARAANHSHSNFIADSVLDRLFYLRAAANTARKEPIAQIRVFKPNGQINARGLAAYLKASNCVVPTDAGSREIGLLSWLTDEDMNNLEELCSVSEAQTKALSKYYALKAVKANPFYSTFDHRKVIFTRIAALKTNESRIAVQRTADQVVNDLCKVVAKALTLICDYRAKRNEM
jgi:hypothetical protein